ncbi:magnesium protoporphyrin IX methyltransferase [Nereida sp. MMG025]|uniref:magnesium protoporphyrin IX methyltransferase n=1 Tax=Nereida sp. MMG025 TaxID=2909981 RepID=UPI001F032833|nr:magnesium protoporphyrin IX methyltransferase [Nereida sp. MMG025]MCF6446012.1 magnesium protoporphyrin IX methyltransferase [Nereida sp. MMG025]
MPAYDQTLTRVETYFDKTATQTWERLTSDAPVSKVRETVRKGRDEMRATMLDTLGDVRGKRILDAGCGAGQMTHELALRGAEVVAVDISPSLVDIARKRLPDNLHHQVTFGSGDMLSPDLGEFDHVVAMDSLIYYTAPDIGSAVSTLFQRTSGKIVFTVAPRTPFLMTFFTAGKLFPRSDRSPVMIPHAPKRLAGHIDGDLRSVKRVSSGFYISECLEAVQ